MLVNDLESRALWMRRKIVDLSFECNHTAHIGGALSMVEMMTVLYGHVMRINPDNPWDEDRDRFILSKGHGVLGYFPALLMAGLIDEEKFNTFMQDGTDLIAHPVMNLDLGIESSNGSLGHGISMAVGVALAARKRGRGYRTYTLIGDGESNEGSVWEAAMLASHMKLSNLTVLVDYNRMQNDGAGKDVLMVDNLGERFRSFGWNVIEVDGHDIGQILEAFDDAHEPAKPKVIVGHTIKGKGIPFMENEKEWHHNRMTKATHELALEALGFEVTAEREA